MDNPNIGNLTFVNDFVHQGEDKKYIDASITENSVEKQIRLWVMSDGSKNEKGIFVVFETFHPPMSEALTEYLKAYSNSLALNIYKDEDPNVSTVEHVDSGFTIDGVPIQSVVPKSE